MQIARTIFVGVAACVVIAAGAYQLTNPNSISTTAKSKAALVKLHHPKVHPPVSTDKISYGYISVPVPGKPTVIIIKEIIKEIVPGPTTTTSTTTTSTTTTTLGNQNATTTTTTQPPRGDGDGDGDDGGDGWGTWGHSRGWTHHGRGWGLGRDRR